LLLMLKTAFTIVLSEVLTFMLRLSVITLDTAVRRLTTDHADQLSEP